MYSRSTLLKMAFSLEKVLHVSRSRINHQFYNTIGLNTLYVSSSHFWPLNNQSDRSLFPMVFSWSSWYSRTTLSSTVSLTSCNETQMSWSLYFRDWVIIPETAPALFGPAARCSPCICGCWRKSPGDLFHRQSCLYSPPLLRQNENIF